MRTPLRYRPNQTCWMAVVGMVLVFVSTMPAWAVTYVSGPATLSRSGETYIVSQNFSCSGTALVITATNVVLDLGGHTITYGTGGATSYGVDITGINAEVKNGILTESAASAALRCHGINSVGPNNVSGPKIHDLTINTVSKGSQGIHLDYAGYGAQVYNNTLNISPTLADRNVSADEVCYGIALLEDYYGTSSNHAAIHHNVINGSSRGIGLMTGVAYVDIYSNEIHHVAPATNAKISVGIMLGQGANHNRIFDNTITTTKGRGITLEADNCDYNQIYGNTIDVGDTQSGEYNRAVGIRLRYGGSYNAIHDNSVTVRTGNNNEIMCFKMGDNAYELATGVPTYNEIYSNTFNMVYNRDQGGAQSCITFGYTGAGNRFYNNTLTTNIEAFEFVDPPLAPVLCYGNTVRKGSSPITGWRTVLVWGNSAPGGPHTLRDTTCGPGVSVDDVQWGSHGGSYDVEWYLTVIVKDAGGAAVPAATVTIQDKNGATVYTGTTASDGTVRAPIRQYKASSAGDTTYTPHTVTASKPGYDTVTNTVTVDASKSLAVTLVGGSSVTLLKQASPGSTIPSGVVTFTITYSNDTGSTIYNAVVTDAIPSAMTYVPGSAKLNGQTITPDPYQNGSLVVSLGNVAAGASGTITFRATVN